jgi:hypothetical protein
MNRLPHSILRPQLWGRLSPVLRAIVRGRDAVQRASCSGTASWAEPADLAPPLSEETDRKWQSQTSPVSSAYHQVSASCLCGRNVQQDLTFSLPNWHQIRAAHSSAGSPGASSTTPHQTTFSGVADPLSASTAKAPPAAAELLFEDAFFSEDPASEAPQKLKPAVYDPGALARHYRWRPLPVLWRACVITWEVGWLRLMSLMQDDITKRAEMVGTFTFALCGTRKLWLVEDRNC